MLDLDARKLTDALAQLVGLCDDLGNLAQTTRAETLGHAVLGLRRNVYDTEPGAYKRTEELLRSTFVDARVTRNTASVTVRNTAPYALFVELGQQGLTVPQLQAIAASMSDPKLPLTFGRSGRRYTIAGPFVAPAQAFALWRLGQLFGERVRQVQRET